MARTPWDEAVILLVAGVVDAFVDMIAVTAVGFFVFSSSVDDDMGMAISSVMLQSFETTDSMDDFRLTESLYKERHMSLGLIVVRRTSVA